MEILIVEDDRRVAALLERGLTHEGHRVFIASDGVEGFDYANLRHYDVIVLDVLLPGIHGVEVAKRLRDRGDRTPILMLTAKDSPVDIVSGLDAGADDYLTKPFAFDELLARLRALSRRGPVARGVLLEIDDLTLNPASHRVRRGGGDVKVTPREYQVLELLMRRAGRVVTRDTLLDTIWGGDSEIGFNNVDAFVSSLRKKIEVPGGQRLIRTVRGVGFSIGGTEA